MVNMVPMEPAHRESDAELMARYVIGRNARYCREDGSMTIQPQPGHWYERRDGEVVEYTCPNLPSHINVYQHIVGYLATSGSPHKLDLDKDLGATDPRKPKKPRKAPAPRN